MCVTRYLGLLQVLLKHLACKIDEMQKAINEWVAILKAKPQMDGGAEVKPELGDEVVGTCTHVRSKNLQSSVIN